MTIIETPANTLPKQSYLEQIDETYKEISGLIKWGNDNEADSEEEQEDSFEPSDSESEYESESLQKIETIEQEIAQPDNPEHDTKEK